MSKESKEMRERIESGKYFFRNLKDHWSMDAFRYRKVARTDRYIGFITKDEQFFANVKEITDEHIEIEMPGFATKHCEIVTYDKIKFL